MTYCVGIRLDAGIVFLSDSRTNAGVDQVRTFRKTHRFERIGERTIVVQTAGNLALSQAALSALRSSFQPDAAGLTLWNARTMFDAATVVGEAVRRIYDARLGGDAALRSRVQLEPHRRRANSRRAAALVQCLQRRQLHRVDGRDAVFPARRSEVRQTDSRPRHHGEPVAARSCEVRARVDGLDDEIQLVGRVTARSRVLPRPTASRSTSTSSSTIRTRISARSAAPGANSCARCSTSCRTRSGGRRAKAPRRRNPARSRTPKSDTRSGSCCRRAARRAMPRRCAGARACSRGSAVARARTRRGRAAFSVQWNIGRDRRACVSVATTSSMIGPLGNVPVLDPSVSAAATRR